MLIIAKETIALAGAGVFVSGDTNSHYFRPVSLVCACIGLRIRVERELPSRAQAAKPMLPVFAARAARVLSVACDAARLTPTASPAALVAPRPLLLGPKTARPSA